MNRIQAASAGLVIVALFCAFIALLHKPVIAPKGVPINGAELQAVGTVQAVETLSTGTSIIKVCNPQGDETVMVFGPTDREPTHLMLKSGIKNLVGHDVWVHGYRRDGCVIAWILYELSDRPETIDEQAPTLAPPAPESPPLAPPAEITITVSPESK